MPFINIPEAAAPATPATGDVIMYAKSDGFLYSKDDAGVETQLGGGGGTGTVTHTSGPLTTSALVVGNGSADINVLASLGTAVTVLHGNAGGLPTFGPVVLTSDVSGTLPVAQGGTGVTSSTGTGSVVLNTSPTLVTPALGTPASGVMTNVTGTASGLTSGITNALKSASTTVDVSAATAPTSGQVLTASSSTAASWADKITLGTSVASTSGTSIDFSGLPAGVRRVVVTVAGVSTNGTASLRIRIGPTAAVETTGYLGAASTIVGSVATTNFTAGFDFSDGNAITTVRHGTIILSLLDSATNTWVAIGNTGQSDSARTNIINGSKPLASALGRVSVTTTNGTDTFDAGVVNIQYE